MEEQNISTTNGMFVKMIKKNIELQCKEINRYYNINPEVEVLAKKMAERVGWQSGKPQVISQAIIHYVSRWVDTVLEYRVFYQLFSLSKKSFKKWVKMLDEL